MRALPASRAPGVPRPPPQSHPRQRRAGLRFLAGRDDDGPSPTREKDWQYRSISQPRQSGPGCTAPHTAPRSVCHDAKSQSPSSTRRDQTRTPPPNRCVTSCHNKFHAYCAPRRNVTGQLSLSNQRSNVRRDLSTLVPPNPKTRLCRLPAPQGKPLARSDIPADRRNNNP
jgi:hypothetical protein